MYIVTIIFKLCPSRDITHYPRKPNPPEATQIYQPQSTEPITLQQLSQTSALKYLNLGRTRKILICLCMCIIWTLTTGILRNRLISTIGRYTKKLLNLMMILMDLWCLWMSRWRLKGWQGFHCGMMGMSTNSTREILRRKMWLEMCISISIRLIRARSHQKRRCIKNHTANLQGENRVKKRGWNCRRWVRIRRRAGRSRTRENCIVG